MSYSSFRPDSLSRVVILVGLLFSSLLLAAAPTLGQQTAARPDRGAVTGAAYAVSDVESVNLNNGNLGLSIPLASLPPVAGGKLSWTVSATYNSKLWNVTRDQEDYTLDQSWQPYTVDKPQKSDLGGWRVGGAYRIYIRNAHEDFAYENPPSNSLEQWEYDLIVNRQWYKVVLQTPDGAERELRPVGASPYNGTAADFLRGYYDYLPTAANPVKYSSFDGTFLTAVVKDENDWTLFMPDGTQVVQATDGIQRINDTNGNSIKIFTDLDGTRHYQDAQTLREIRVAYDPSANGGQGQYQVWYPLTGGGSAMVAVNMGKTLVQGKIYGVTDWHPTGGEPPLQGITCTRDELLQSVNLDVVREIVFPPTEPDRAARRFSFGYNSDATETFTTSMYRPACGMGFETLTTTASVGWGALNRMVTPLGAEVKYSYDLDSDHSAGQLSADAMAEEKVVRKEVVYDSDGDGDHDGDDETDVWTYEGAQVTNPDGSYLRHWSFDHGAGFANFGVGMAGLVFRTESPGVMVERHYTNLTFAGAGTDSPGGPVTYNPVVDAEYTTLLEPPSPGASPVPVKMSAKTFKHDYNGNVTEVREYDWYTPPGPEGRDGLGVPTGAPPADKLLRTTLTSYHNSPVSNASSPLVYAKRGLATGTPSIINAVKETATGPSVTRMSYDGQDYDFAPIRGNVTQVSRLDDKGDGPSANDTWVSTSSTYDPANGNLLTATDALGRVTQFFYDDASKALPTRVIVDPLNGTGQQVTTTAYDPHTGLVVSTTDPNGATSEVSYVNQLTGAVDPFGRPGVTTAPAVTAGGASRRRKTFNFYEDAARRVRVETDLNDQGDRLLKSRETRDELGRVVLSEQNEGGASYTISSKIVYAEKGRVVLKSHPTRGDGTLADGWTRVTSNDRGRVVEAATFEGSAQPAPAGYGANWKGSVRTEYYAEETTVTDQENKSRRSVTDALGRLVRVVEAPNVPGYGFVTSYAYDSLGNLRRVDQGGQLRYFMYDSLGRLIRAKNPEQGNLTPDSEELPPDQKHFPALTDPVTGNGQWSLAYNYDANGNLTRRKDARDFTTVYTYDALNRSKTVDYLNTGVGIDVERYYDGATKGKGRLWTTWSGGPPATTANQHTAVDAYDELGRPLTQRQLFKKADGTWQTYSVSRTYGLAGNVLTQTYPSGRTVSYNYDAAGRLSGFAGNLGDGAQRTYSAQTLYDAAGRMRQEQFGTETPLYNKRFYNVAGQLSNIRLSTYSITAPGQDGNWNRGAIVNHYSEQSWAGSGSDNNGNLKKQEVYLPSHDQPGYDTLGSYTQMAQHYAYDELNRLKSVTEFLNNQTPPTFKQAYTYDRWGNRTIDALNTSDTAALWDVPEPQFSVGAAGVNRLGVPAGDTRVMQYDAAGNLTTDTYQGGQGGGGTRTYDAEGRMTSAQFVSGQSQNAVYTYDADGRRVRRKIGAAEVWQVYGMEGELLAEYAAEVSHTSPQKEYGYRAGELLITAEAGAGGTQGDPGPAYGGTPASVPGRIEVERFDTGGQGAGHYDTTQGSHGQDYDQPPSYPPPSFRQPTDVDIYKSAGYSGGYLIVGQAGDWMKYTVDVASAGTYTMEARVAWGNGQGGTFRVEVDGVDKTGPILIPDTNWSLQTVTKAGVQLPSGRHTLRVVWETDGAGGCTGDIDYLRFMPDPAGVKLTPVAATASNTYTTYTASKAVDGDPATWWSAGNFPAQWIELDLGQARDLTKVRLLVNQDPAGRTVHEVWGGATQGGLSLLGTLDQTTQSGQWLELTAAAAGVRYVKVKTTLSPSWVGWSEVEVYGAGAAASTGANIRWLVSDQLGTPRMVVDQTGSLGGVRRHDYLPFGEELPVNVGGRTPERGYGFDNIRQQFAGEERDDETGLDYLSARYYSSAQGRFTSPDSVAGNTFNPQTLNLYAYVKNQPLRYIDPTGHTPQDPQNSLPPGYAVYSDDWATNGVHPVSEALHNETVDVTGSSDFVLDTIADVLAVGVDLVDGVGDGTAQSLTFGIVGRGPLPTDSLVNRFGQIVGTVTVGLAGAELGGGGGAVTIGSGGTLSVVSVPAAAAGATLVVGAAVNAVKIVTTPIQMGNTNPFSGPVDQDVFIGDGHGNNIPVRTGEQTTGSPDGKWVQVRDGSGNPTGTRLDGPHRPSTHPDPRAQAPHGHVPGVRNPDGTPWLKVKP